MKLYQEGDQGKALCNQCQKQVTTTFLRRDVPFSDGNGAAKCILVGVCDACSHIVSIPAQSTPAIREVRHKEWVSVEANLPAIYLDMLDMAVYSIDPSSSTQFRKVVLAFFLHRFAHNKKAPSLLERAYKDALIRFDEPRGILRRRLSMKVSSRIANDLNTLVRDTQMNQTELLKSVIFQIQKVLVHTPEPALLKELNELSAIAS